MLFHNWVKKLRQFSIDLAWMHWNRLGVRGSGPLLRCSTDPETLLLWTALVGQEDARLWEAAAAWIENYESLIPIDRFKNLIKDNNDPAHMLPKLATLLRTALDPTRQTRWEFVINRAPLPLSEEAVSKALTKNRLQDHSWIIRKNYLIYLRYLFGPSIRADALYYILVVSNQPEGGNEIVLTTPELRRAISYDPSAISRTLESLARAGVIKELKFPDEDQRSKFYSLSGEDPLFGQYARHAGRRKQPLQSLPDYHYVCWPPLLEIAKDIDRLDAFSSATVDRSLEDSEPLIKSRLNTFLFSFQHQLRRSNIPLDVRVPGRLPLKDIPLEDMMMLVDENLAGVKEFLMEPQ